MNEQVCPELLLTDAATLQEKADILGDCCLEVDRPAHVNGPFYFDLLAPP